MATTKDEPIVSEPEGEIEKLEQLKQDLNVPPYVGLCSITERH
jgi:hypothetical protein